MSNQYVGKALFDFSIYIGHVSKSETQLNGIWVELKYWDEYGWGTSILLVPHEEISTGRYSFRD